VQPSLLPQQSVSLKQAAMSLLCADEFNPLGVWLEGCVSSLLGYTVAPPSGDSCLLSPSDRGPASRYQGLHAGLCIIIIRVWLDLVLRGAHVEGLQHLVSRPSCFAHGHSAMGQSLCWSNLVKPASRVHRSDWSEHLHGCSWRIGALLQRT